MLAERHPALYGLRFQAVFPETQDRAAGQKFCNCYPPCRKVWAAGKRVVKFIGYDAGESYRSDKVLLATWPTKSTASGIP